MRSYFFKLVTVLFIFTSAGNVNSLKAADPTSTDFSYNDCRGSAKPYPVPSGLSVYPDSLRPLFISHIGRHGARYPSSPKHTSIVEKSLKQAIDAGTITAKGKRMLALSEQITALSNGRWGALDSLGISEQWGIASRMYATYPELFNNKNISAISSYAPRCIMSMYSFLHQLTRLDNKMEIDAQSGRKFSHLLRFFDSDPDYTDYVKGDSWRKIYQAEFKRVEVDRLLRRFMGDNFPIDEINKEETLMAIYSVVAGTASISLDIDISEFFTTEEFNSLWQMFNLRQYMLHSASTLSSVPADIASPLLLEIISSADRTISDIDSGRSYDAVQLRFGHAETLMPLFTLMKIDHAYYLTNYFDTVGKHWHDFQLVPMAANLQLIFFRNNKGDVYVRCDINEQPVPPIPGDSRIYLPWHEVRSHFERCIPIYMQL